MSTFDYNPLTFPGPALPESCYRALHSYVTEAVLQLNTEHRHRIVDQCQGLPATYERFMFSVFQGRLTVDIVPDAATGQPWLWVAYPRDNNLTACPIVAVLGSDIGADPELLLIELAMRLEGTLEHIVALGEVDE